MKWTLNFDLTADSKDTVVQKLWRLNHFHTKLSHNFFMTWIWQNYAVFFNLQSCFIIILSRCWWSYLFCNVAVLNWSDHIIIDDINWILVSAPTQYWFVHNRVMYIKISINMSIWRNILKTLMWNQILEKN